ncbi:MAG: hypothetical protein MUP69_10265 [Candidatus Atribacteria bacterium]|nr:hypothetical protein [Candidatus Atribacteria bacterium]
MPLEVVTANRGKDYSIFEKLNPFVEKIVNIYNQSQQNKWNNEWMTAAISDIENANDNKSVDLMSKINPPADYIDTEGVTKFANDAVGLLQQKKLEMGILPQTAPEVTEGQIPQTELLPDVKEFNDLYKFVSELPTGQVDWTNTLNVFKKKLEGKRAIGSAAQQFLTTILGQTPTDQRAEFEKNLDLTKKYMDVLYPEGEKPNSELEYWLQENPDKGVEDYWKAKKEPEKQTEWDKKLDIIMQLNPSEEELRKFLGIYITPENQSDFDKKFNLIMKTNPTSDEMKKFLGTYIAPKGPGTTDKITTTEMNYVDTQFEGILTNEQYNTALNKVTAIDSKLAKQVPSKEKIFKDNYDNAMALIKLCINGSGQITEGDNPNDEGYTYEQSYQIAYDALQTAIQEYQKATGQVLENPYVSLDEYNKSDKTKWYNPTTWGSQPSVKGQ